MSSTADVIAMSHFGKTVELKIIYRLFPVTLSGVSSFGIPYEDSSFMGSNRNEINIFMSNYASE